MHTEVLFVATALDTQAQPLARLAAGLEPALMPPPPPLPASAFKVVSL